MECPIPFSRVTQFMAVKCAHLFPYPYPFPLLCPLSRPRRALFKPEQLSALRGIYLLAGKDASSAQLALRNSRLLAYANALGGSLVVSHTELSTLGKEVTGEYTRFQTIAWFLNPRKVPSYHSQSHSYPLVNCSVSLCPPHVISLQFPPSYS